LVTVADVFTLLEGLFKKDDAFSKGVGPDGEKQPKADKYAKDKFDKQDKYSKGEKGEKGPKEYKYQKPEKWISAGGVVLGGKDDLDHVYIRKPSNNFGPWSFPKGQIDKGESKETTALREVEEEIGIVAEIVPGGYLGTGEGSYSITHYYLMYAKRDLGRHDKETEKVLLADFVTAVHKFAKGSNSRDIQILTRAMDLVAKLKRQRAEPER
jgi:8-oxo-dGTP diphosphatase